MPKSGRQPPQRSHPCRRRSAHTTPPVLHGNRTVLESALLRHHRRMVHVPDARYAFESIDLKEDLDGHHMGGGACVWGAWRVIG